MLRIVNLSGQPIRVIPWEGARARLVRCGQSRLIRPAGAPRPPWVVTVRTATGGKLLFRRKVFAAPLDIIALPNGARATTLPVHVPSAAMASACRR